MTNCKWQLFRLKNVSKLENALRSASKSIFAMGDIIYKRFHSLPLHPKGPPASTTWRLWVCASGPLIQRAQLADKVFAGYGNFKFLGGNYSMKPYIIWFQHCKKKKNNEWKAMGRQEAQEKSSEEVREIDPGSGLWVSSVDCGMPYFLLYNCGPFPPFQNQECSSWWREGN